MRIVAAMSGGVDSSVAAAMLAADGYDVVGLSMQLYDQSNGEQSFGSCCTLDDLAEARQVANHLGIPHYVVNFERQFEETVVSQFVREYSVARTPIPCVHCNSELKFSNLLDRARGLDADCVATGHYARVELVEYNNPEQHSRYVLRRARDTQKDQTYFLFSLTQNQLEKAMFPLGDLMKKDVRRYASEQGLQVADKPDSHEICFVPDGDYAAFIERREPSISRSGPVKDSTGRILGHHDGIHRFTVGQRKGLGISSSERLYVTSLNATTDTVTLGPRAALERTTLTASKVNWISVEPEPKTVITAKVRHHHPEAPARVWPLSDKRLKLQFDSPQTAITPGQAVVLYDGDLVLGGGWID